MASYPLASDTWSKEEVNAILDVIESKKFTMGDKVKELEKEFANFFKSKYCVMTSSGSTANLIGIASLFFRQKNTLKKGDEVIVPAVSWSTTYFPLQQYGLKLKFIDIDLNTLNYDLIQLEKAITNKTKLIVAVNLLGNPNNFTKIKSIIKGKEIILMEDNCESMGAKFGSEYTGTFGIIGTFSSFFSHHIATMEGGYILTDDEEIYHILLSLRAHGWTRDLPMNNLVTSKSNNAFNESFRFVLPGYNVRPIEMSGAIGIQQLKKLPDFLYQRKKNADLFKKLFADSQKFIFQKEIGESSWFGFSFVIKPECNIDRESIIQELNRNHIDVRPIVTGNFVRNEVMKYIDHEVFGDLKNADLIHEKGFFVGNSHQDLTSEIKFLYSVLKDLGEVY